MFQDQLDLATFNSLLATETLGRAVGWPNECWEDIDSTNTRLLELSGQGAPEGLIVMARQQTAGKGRLGRTWVSPKDCGLYFSVLLRPEMPQNVLPLLSFAAGIAVLEAIATTSGYYVGLKWVNDIVYGGRKLGGILAEATTKQAVVVGIGINLRTPQEMPDELRQTAISIEQISEQPVDPNQLAAYIAARLEAAYALLKAGRHDEVLRRWKKFSVTLGKHVRATTSQGVIEGVAKDLAPDGALMIEKPDGEMEFLYAGDVSIRNADGSYA